MSAASRARKPRKWKDRIEQGRCVACSGRGGVGLAPNGTQRAENWRHIWAQPINPWVRTLTVRSLSTRRLGDFRSRWMMGGLQVCRKFCRGRREVHGVMR